MSSPLITILSVNYKTSDFIDLMLFSFKNLTSSPYKVIICDNFTSNEEVERLMKVTDKYTNTEVILRKQSQFGSIGHAEAIDLLISKVDTPYFVTMDSDALFLKKNWDLDLISRINDRVKLIGTTLPPSQNSLKPIDFPLAFAVLYETNTYKELGVSFMPKDLDSNPSQDTGWELRDKYLGNKYSGDVFKGKNTKQFHNTPFGHLYCAVYYLDDYLIASHFGRGSSGGIAKYNTKWWFNIPYLSRIIRKYIGLKEKKEWIDICRKIILKEVSKC
ncbi:glycosyltransferase [Vibrio coralliilyticus]|uniref:glycosyltransferase family 2 protein n=1 Tax=Vibrio coralliilyticus TaxID=190893 RepID=UPI00148D99FB|nr:glycosyltransferase [Vibrio coralliilyticus]NOH55540.1 glycosyltransferase [Vibrio coralliilyticus]